jgi:hypothetical protein
MGSVCSVRPAKYHFNQLIITESVPVSFAIYFIAGLKSHEAIADLLENFSMNQLDLSIIHTQYSQIARVL